MKHEESGRGNREWVGPASVGFGAFPIRLLCSGVARVIQRMVNARPIDSLFPIPYSPLS